jgi:uracil-DNA glycosylase family 4
MMSEVIKKKDILSFINFYREIGVSTIAVPQEKFFDEKFIKKPQTSTIKTDKISSVDIQIKNLEESFNSLEGFNLKKTAINFIPFQGNFNSNILVVDGIPNADEDKLGQSFVGEKGTLFNKMLNAIGLDIENIFIATGIPWRPPGNRYPTSTEIEICRPYIYSLIKILKPTIILCIGEIATSLILKTNQPIIKSRGQWDELCLTTNENKTIIAKVLPTLSISYLLTRPDMKRHAWEDMKLLRDQIKEIKL